MEQLAGLSAAAAWLMGDARRADSVPKFLTGLAGHACAQGTPITVASLVVEALHPIIAGTR